MTTPAVNDGAVIEVFQGDSRRIIQFAPARVGMVWRVLVPLSDAPVQQILEEYDYDLLVPGTRAEAPYTVPYYLLAGAMRCILENTFGSCGWQQHWAKGHSDRRRSDTYWVEVFFSNSRWIIQIVPTHWQFEWQVLIVAGGGPGEDLVEDDYYAVATGACLTAEGAFDQAMRNLVEDLNDSADWQQYWQPAGQASPSEGTTRPKNESGRGLQTELAPLQDADRHRMNGR